MTRATKARVRFALLNEKEWGVPLWIDRKKFDAVLGSASYYGNTEAYRKMCRFFAGPVFQTKMLEEYDYAWRLDSHVRYLCDIVDDPIAKLSNTNSSYGFAMRMNEKMDTIPTLWSTVAEFARNRGLGPHLAEHWDVDLGSHTISRGCHYWNNFEITDLAFFRSQRYQEYFTYLDRSGGFFYERWGDAPVRTFGLMLLSQRPDIIWFEEVGYQHPWWYKCPPANAVCFGRPEGCVPDPEIQPHTATDGKMCEIGQ